MLLLSCLFFKFSYSAKKFNATTVDFVDVANYSDLFMAMRKLHNSENLTNDGFIIVTNSSQYNADASNRKSVDCIVQDPLKYISSRFVSGANDPQPWVILDFLTSKVTLRHYTLYYAYITRFMVDYVLYGEEYPGSWAVIDRRVAKASDFSSFYLGGTKIYTQTYPVTTPLRNYSRFKFVGIGPNSDDMTNPNKEINDPTKITVTMAKLLFYGTIYPGVNKYSPIKLKRKEQMMFNFAMFSSLV